MHGHGQAFMAHTGTFFSGYQIIPPGGMQIPNGYGPSLKSTHTQPRSPSGTNYTDSWNRGVRWVTILWNVCAVSLCITGVWMDATLTLYPVEDSIYHTLASICILTPSASTPCLPDILVTELVLAVVAVVALCSLFVRSVRCPVCHEQCDVNEALFHIRSTVLMKKGLSLGFSFDITSSDDIGYLTVTDVHADLKIYEGDLVTAISDNPLNLVTLPAALRKLYDRDCVLLELTYFHVLQGTTTRNAVSPFYLLPAVVRVLWYEFVPMFMSFF